MTDQILTVLVLLGVIAAVMLAAPTQDKSEWHSVTRYSSVRLISGEMCSDTRLWGRKVNGKWQYKRMTAEEYNLDLADRSI